MSEREEEELLSLSPQPSIISTVTHGATKKNLIHPSKERDYGGAKYGGGASTERAEVTTDTFTQPYPLAYPPLLFLLHFFKFPAVSISYLFPVLCLVFSRCKLSYDRL